MTPAFLFGEGKIPYVNVKVSGKPLSAARKRAVIKGITDVLVSELGKDPDYTFVVIEEIPGDNWGWKGTSVTEVRKAEAAAKRSVVTRAASGARTGRGAPSGRA